MNEKFENELFQQASIDEIVVANHDHESVLKRYTQNPLSRDMIYFDEIPE